MNELPKKWLVVFETKEKAEVIINYFKEMRYIFGVYTFTGTDRAFTNEGIYLADYRDAECDVIRISFEDFKRLVLKEVPKFEVGKWYNITNDLGQYYIKPLIISDYYLDRCEYISGRTFIGPYGAFAISQITSSKILTDLSEIQQYLPERHVDKAKMQKGKWYIIENSHSPYNCVNIVKVEKDWYGIGDLIGDNEGFYNVRTCHGDSSGWLKYQSDLTDIVNYKELSIEEVQEYLPEGHTDKQVIQNNMRELKITEEKIKETIKNHPDSKEILESLFPEVKEVTYSVGQRFKIDGRLYLLSRTDHLQINLFDLNSGNRWHTPVNVRDPYKVTIKEFKSLVSVSYILINDND